MWMFLLWYGLMHSISVTVEFLDSDKLNLVLTCWWVAETMKLMAYHYHYSDQLSSCLVVSHISLTQHALHKLVAFSRLFVNLVFNYFVISRLTCTVGFLEREALCCRRSWTGSYRCALRSNTYMIARFCIVISSLRLHYVTSTALSWLVYCC